MFVSSAFLTGLKRNGYIDYHFDLIKDCNYLLLTIF